MPDPEPSPPPARQFREVKRHLGRPTVKTFSCELLDRTPDRAVLRYLLPAEAQVGGLTLPAGTATIAFYWPDRPYNVYQWLAADGATLGHYLNVSGPVRITADQLEWEDWIVDVLVLPGGTVRVLDEAELDAAELEPDARVAVRHALATALEALPAVVAETTAATRVLVRPSDPIGPPPAGPSALPDPIPDA